MTKHGGCYSKLYRVWVHMRERCRCTTNSRYYRYGERGIKVCDGWEKSFATFREWALSSGYQEGLTIDRINNNGNYEPSNCRFATYTEQNNNFSRNNFVTYKGITLSVCQWSKQTGIHHNTLDYRIKKGWDIGKALNYPDIIQHGDAFQVRENNWSML